MADFACKGVQRRRKLFVKKVQRIIKVAEWTKNLHLSCSYRAFLLDVKHRTEM